MKKSIFLFFAAILCAMTANAQLYLRGGFNDWGTGDKFKFVDNVCEIELAGGTTYEFKIASSNWNPEYGNGAFIATATKTLTSKGGNMKVTTTIPGTYKFEFVESTKKLTVTYPEVPAPHDITVRAKLPATWTSSTITAWVWTSENASGTKVTAEKDGDYYKITKNAGALYVIFRNGADWNGDKNQTVDLCYTEDVCLQLNQSGSAKATATVIDCGAVSKDITVKAVVPGAWEDKITAWVWPTGGEGKEVTPTKEGNWYVVTENCIELNVIFKNGEGWKGNENQTANITGVSENTCYQISALNKDGEGKCTYTVVDCEAAIEPEAKPVDVYTIVGAETLVGTAWDFNNTDNDMTKQGDGSYVLVKENVELATTGTYEYKVVKNRSWDWKGVNEGNNLTLTGVDVDGTYNVTFTLNKELNALTTSLELVEAKKVIPECYVAGDESLTGQNWDAKSVSMTYDEATEVYTATLTAVPAGTHNMKVVYGGEWLGFDHLATPAPANVTEGEDKKIQFTLAEAGDVTVTYHATNGIGLEGNFAAPVTYDYYIAGTLAGGWSATQQGMEKVGEVYKHIFTALAAGTYQFKITDGKWNTEEDKTHEYTTLGADYEEVSIVGGNVQIEFTGEAKDITVIFDATNKNITFEGLTEKAPVEKHYYLIGSFNEWTKADATNELLLDGEVYKKEVTLAKDAEFKVNDGADAWWGFANLGGKTYAEVIQGNDANLKMKEEKTFTVIFDPANNLITFEDLTETVTTITYVLMGVNNDWTTGIALTQNPDNADEYVLENQVIIKATDAVKVVTLTNGTATAWCGNVDSYSNATYTGGGEDNIVLEDGIYTFYFKKTDNNIYINQTGYARTATPGSFSTICLPYAGTISGATLFDLSDRDANYVYVVEAGIELEAGKPYVILPTEDKITVTYKNYDYVTAGSYNALYGTYEEMNSDDLDGKYVITGDKYYYVDKALSAGSKLLANRAYFKLNELPEVAPVLPVGARRIALGTNGQNTATGMENVDASAQPVKTIINGQLYILRGEKMYDAQGKLVK